LTNCTTQSPTKAFPFSFFPIKSFPMASQTIHFAGHLGPYWLEAWVDFEFEYTAHKAVGEDYLRFGRWLIESVDKVEVAYIEVDVLENEEGPCEVNEEVKALLCSWFYKHFDEVFEKMLEEDELARYS
jgi:hypothetical protein